MKFASKKCYISKNKTAMKSPFLRGKAKDVKDDEEYERNLSDIEYDSSDLDEDMSGSDEEGSLSNSSKNSLEEIKEVEEKPKKGFWSSLFGGSKKKAAPANRLSKKRAAPERMMARSAMKESAPKKKKAKKKFSRAIKKNRKFRQEIDTNVVSVGFEVLEQDAQVAAGDAVFCEKCNCVFSKHSKIKSPQDLQEEVKEDFKMEEDLDGKQMMPAKKGDEVPFDEEDQVWVCEFCYNKNVVNLEKEEIPTEEAVNYILEIDEDKIKKGSDKNSVIFCLDISGSMCVTTPVEGKIKIKGDKLNELQDLMKFSDGSDQFYQGRRNFTYISRLQCVQAAIESQIIEMNDKTPDLKVGLVSFSNDVTIHGDCNDVPQTISGDKLNDFEYLKKNGIDSTDTHLQKPINEVCEKLTSKLFSLEESGPTALGPALLTSIAMASQGSAGSSVVLCTDGLSNVGLGSIEGKQQEEAAEFYTQLANFAHENGVTVNIISIAGEECDLETLRCIPEKTGGDIQRVEADKLTENFANILSAPIIATDVKMKVILHKGLEFRNEEEENLNSDKNVLTKSMGNVTSDSEMTFEYKVKPIELLKDAKEFDITKLESFPFQTQIEYTKLDGMKCIRVDTKVQEITNDRSEVEKEADAEIIGTNCVQQAAKLARRGSFRHAQAYMKSQKQHWGENKNSAQVSEKVTDHLRGVKNMYGMLQNQNDMEQLCESDDESEVKKYKLSSSKKAFKSHKSKMNDEMTYQVHAMSKFSRKK